MSQKHDWLAIKFFIQKPIDSLLDTAAGDDGILCQFCDKMFALHEIERHQKSCPVRSAPHNVETDIGHFAMRSGPGGASSLTENKDELEIELVESGTHRLYSLCIIHVLVIPI